MKNMPYDPILTEMHAIKDSISEECNHDIDKLFDKLQALDPIMAEMHAIKDTNAERFGGDLKRLLTHLRKLDSKTSGIKARPASTTRQVSLARRKTKKKPLASI